MYHLGRSSSPRQLFKPVPAQWGHRTWHIWWTSTYRSKRATHGLQSCTAWKLLSRTLICAQATSAGRGIALFGEINVDIGVLNIVPYTWPVYCCAVAVVCCTALYCTVKQQRWEHQKSLRASFSLCALSRAHNMASTHTSPVSVPTCLFLSTVLVFPLETQERTRQHGAQRTRTYIPDLQHFCLPEGYKTATTPANIPAVARDKALSPALSHSPKSSWCWFG